MSKLLRWFKDIKWALADGCWNRNTSYIYIWARFLELFFPSVFKRVFPLDENGDDLLEWKD